MFSLGPQPCLSSLPALPITQLQIDPGISYLHAEPKLFLLPGKPFLHSVPVMTTVEDSKGLEDSPYVPCTGKSFLDSSFGLYSVLCHEQVSYMSPVTLSYWPI